MGRRAGEAAGVCCIGLVSSVGVPEVLGVVLKQGERPWWWLASLLASLMGLMGPLLRVTWQHWGKCWGFQHEFAWPFQWFGVCLSAGVDTCTFQRSGIVVVRLLRL